MTEKEERGSHRRVLPKAPQSTIGAEDRYRLAALLTQKEKDLLSAFLASVRPADRSDPEKLAISQS
jgi:hypothetical protein